MDVQPAIRRRAPRVNAEFARAAVDAVRPLNRQIGAWQSRVALLEALSSHRTGDVSEDIKRQASELMQTVTAEQRAFARQVATLPPQVAAETRIADTARAMSTVLKGIERILGRGADPVVLAGGAEER
jgi:hypothetical protein